MVKKKKKITILGSSEAEHMTVNHGVGISKFPRGAKKREYRIAAIAGDCKSPDIRLRRFESYCSHKWARCQRQVDSLARRSFGFDSHCVHNPLKR